MVVVVVFPFSLLLLLVLAEHGEATTPLIRECKQLLVSSREEAKSKGLLQPAGIAAEDVSKCTALTYAKPWQPKPKASTSSFGCGQWRPPSRTV